MIAPVTVLAAGRALFLHVGDLAIRGHFPIVASDAAAGKRRKPEETNQTHHVTPALLRSKFCTAELYKTVAGIAKKRKQISDDDQRATLVSRSE